MIVFPFILLAVLVTLLGFFVCWTLAIVKLVRRQPLLAYEPRRVVPWGLVDLGLVVLILFVGAALSGVLLKGQFGPGAGTDDQPFTLQQNMLLILADTAMKVAVMVIVTPVIMLRAGCTWQDLGVVPSEAARDIGIGLAAFCMLAPIVYALQAALTQLEPYKHPLIEMLTQTPDLQLFALLAFSAAILAPLSEEWAFRVLLQGWLEKLVTYVGNPLHVLFGGRNEVPLPAMLVDDHAAAAAAVDGISYLPPTSNVQPEIVWMDPANPYAPPQVMAAQPGLLVPGAWSHGPGGDVVPPIWKQCIPIFLSALIFALMHFSHGLAWIPLTLLALGLGYIYQRTHRILPSITVHFCLNALSMGAFWVQMFEAPQLQLK
jgi:membrane protease YdiL (CAAX protease family)